VPIILESSKENIFFFKSRELKRCNFIEWQSLKAYKLLAKKISTQKLKLQKRNEKFKYVEELLNEIFMNNVDEVVK